MEQHLKERLVGAVVLATAAVIVIPIILTGSPSLEPVSDAGNGAGGPDDATVLQPFNSKIVPLGSATQLGVETPSEPSSAAPLTTPVLPKSRPARALPAAPAKAAPKPVRKAQSSASSAPARVPSGSRGWLVQLGSFGNARNATGLREKLKKKAYPAFTDTSKTDKGEVTRVFVGPSSSRQQANQLAARLFAEFHLKGLVIRQP